VFCRVRLDSISFARISNIPYKFHKTDAVIQKKTKTRLLLCLAEAKSADILMVGNIVSQSPVLMSFGIHGRSWSSVFFFFSVVARNNSNRINPQRGVFVTPYHCIHFLYFSDLGVHSPLTSSYLAAIDRVADILRHIVTSEMIKHVSGLLANLIS
jgi:hypothetical protein